jgi:hypothetical protein
MRVYRCNTEGCGKGLITDLQPWGFCPKCGGLRWKKLRRSTYWTMVRIWWISGRQLVVPPEGSWLERFLVKRLQDQAENVFTEERVRREVPQFYQRGGSHG